MISRVIVAWAIACTHLFSTNSADHYMLTSSGSSSSTVPLENPSKCGGDIGVAVSTAMVDRSLLVVTARRGFADKIARQLGELNYRLSILAPRQVTGSHCVEQYAVKVALVDLPSEPAEQPLVHRLIREVHPTCQIILLCNSEEIAVAAEFVRRKEAFDFVCVESVVDEHRLPLMIEWASADGRRQASVQPGMVPRPLAPVQNDFADVNSGPGENGHNRNSGGSPRDLAAKRPVLESERDVAEANSPFIALPNSQDLGVTQILPSRILVVDDDDVSATVASGLLESFGFTVDVATNADSAMRVLSRQKPDLILMDVHLDHANGLDVVLTLREGLICPDVPVIVVTADRSRGTLADALGVEVQGYVLKPYESTFLVEKVCNVLHSRHHRAVELPPTRGESIEAAALADCVLTN